LRKAQFAIRKAVVVVGLFALVAFVGFGIASVKSHPWIFLAVSFILAAGAWVIFSRERSIVKNPLAIAAKVTRNTPFYLEGGVRYRIHYIFLTPQGEGYTGRWTTYNEEGREYAAGMFLPVLYDGREPDRNRAWGTLYFYKTV